MKTIKVCGRRDRGQADVHRISAFRSSNLNGQKNTHRMVCVFFVISVHFRYRFSLLVPARFGTIFFPLERKFKVRLRRAVAGNCPPDSCI